MDRSVALGLLGMAVGACSAPGGSDSSTAPLGTQPGAGTGSGDPGGGLILGGGAGLNQPCANVLQNTLQPVYRDFSEAHPDFEMPFLGDVVRVTLLQPQLGADSKPIFRSRTGCPSDFQNPLACAPFQTSTVPVIQSAESFDQWYRTVPGVNIESNGSLELIEQSPGSGVFIFDSAEFFPLGPGDGFGVTPADHFLGRNFLFTTEIHVTFTYSAGQIFSFRGDDDLWVFVNGRLAMDLGSVHSAASGSIDFDALATQLGIVPGTSYPMDIFHAERHTTGSNFRFETNITCFVPVDLR